jgi:hypothetical protein
LRLSRLSVGVGVSGYVLCTAGRGGSRPLPHFYGCHQRLKATSKRRAACVGARLDAFCIMSREVWSMFCLCVQHAYHLQVVLALAAFVQLPPAATDPAAHKPLLITSPAWLLIRDMAFTGRRLA